MTLSFNDSGLMQGLFITNILPKCQIKKVKMLPVGECNYYVDGYSYGGYKDYYVHFEESTKTLALKTDSEVFHAVKIE